MPRTLHAAGIRAWRYEQLINDLALGEKSYPDLAEIYGVEDQTVRLFAMKHRAEVEAKKADLASEYGHIWSTKVGNRLRVLTCRLEEIEEQLELLRSHACAETELIRTVDPEASEVTVNSREYLAYVKEQRSLLREIADQTGQLPARVSKIEVEGSSLTSFDTIALDADGNWHAVK